MQLGCPWMHKHTLYLDYHYVVLVCLYLVIDVRKVYIIRIHTHTYEMIYKLGEAYINFVCDRRLRPHVLKGLSWLQAYANAIPIGLYKTHVGSLSNCVS